MEKKVELTFEGKTLHLSLGHTEQEWKEKYGERIDFWSFRFEELIDGTIEPSEDLVYWYIDGRCYETDEEV